MLCVEQQGDADSDSEVLTSPCQKNEYVFNLARYNELSHNSHKVL